MPNQRIIFQGITENNHLGALHWLWETPNIEKIYISVAFISNDGVDKVQNLLMQHPEKTTVIAGIRNEITSLQALMSLLSSDINLQVFDTGSRQILFHPKIYLVRGAEIARCLIGSANLTLGGLNNNIETSVGLEYELANTDDLTFITHTEELLTSLISTYPENVKEISDPSELEALKNSGYLQDETIIKTGCLQREQTTANQIQVPRIRLCTNRINGTLRHPATRVRAANTSNHTHGTNDLQLVWQSKPLEERDLSTPSGEGTHATGSMNLDKGLLEAEVDHRSYFRNEVFQDLAWEASTDTTEKATAKFTILINGVLRGQYELIVRHTTSTDTKAYRQRNAMTRLSLGDANSIISDRSLIGGILSLYKNLSGDQEYVIAIDT